MVTQKIVTRLSNDVLPPVRMVSGDVGREIQLEIYASDESTTPIDLENYHASITIIKPDNTFVITNFNADKVELPEQAGAVTGHGYYQIKIYTAGDHQIYTGQGPFIVDDDILSEETIESIAEANGYKFPDDFLTDVDLREYVKKYELEDAIAGIIDDDETAANSTWSSAKINEELSNIGTTVTKTATGNPIEISDGAEAPLVKCVTQITGYQSGTGTPSPDNVRPITAYTEGEIVVRDGDGNTTTHTTTYPSAIYRGNADFVGGTASADWGIITYYGTEAWTDNTQYGAYRWYLNLLPSNLDTANKTLSISNQAVYEDRQGSFGSVFSFGGSGIYLNKITASETLADLQAKLSSNNLVIAYPLATPTTEQISPTNLPIKSLSGYSHIESTTGDMEIEYITQQWDPIMEATRLDNVHAYSTSEKVVGVWVDGSAVYEKTYIYTGSGAANPFTATIDMTGKSIIEVIPHYVKFTYGGGTVGYCAGSALVNNNSKLLNVAYDDDTPPTVRVTSYIGSSTESYEVAFTIRYI